MPIEPAVLATYLVACAVMVVVPGPDTAFVLGQTLARGRRAGWAATCGIYAGASVHITLAALGVSTAVAASPVLFEAVRLVGATYLLWLGVLALCAAFRRDRSALTAAPPARRAFVQGMLTNLLNPKVTMFFLAFLPQFVDPARGPVWLQMMLLGPLLPLLSVPFFAAVIVGADRVAARVSAGPGVRWLHGATGAIFVGLAARLALAR
ncbi:LysE family translocator [Elioraea tepidiphila]|uniref:LysE family translocator n=1 Tax=Elioraea tepidiphila TaxID=457934 RepID=UPI000362A067|nr:LysE family translocator [Elioraea tepidiphila]